MKLHIDILISYDRIRGIDLDWSFRITRFLLKLEQEQESGTELLLPVCNETNLCTPVQQCVPLGIKP